MFVTNTYTTNKLLFYSTAIMAVMTTEETTIYQVVPKYFNQPTTLADKHSQDNRQLS
jgi:hypothetical protein